MQLLVNVATREKYVLYYDEAGVSWAHYWDTLGQESREVLAAVRKGEHELGIRMAKDVTQIVCISGPGPFTSLRVAVSVLNTILYVHPSIQGSVLTTGQLFSILDRHQHSGYLFQPYPSDYFFFDETGALLSRETNYSDGPVGRYAGQVLQGDVDVVPDIQNSAISIFQSISDTAKKCEGLLIPFYAKEPNITTPKK